MQVAESARTHGIEDDDILHAWRNVMWTAEQDYKGETRIIAIGPARNSAPLELVLVPADGLSASSTQCPRARPFSSD